MREYPTLEVLSPVWGMRSHVAVPRVAGKEITESMTRAMFCCFTLVIFPPDRMERHPAINASSD